MENQSAITASASLAALGDFRWVRVHVSTYAVGAVFLVCVNLIIGGSRLWSLTAIGIWSMLLIVHLILLAIARLLVELQSDDDEEVVLLPVKDATIVIPTPDPTATWSTVARSESTEQPPPGNDEAVSWQIATDAAQRRKQSADEPEAEST